MRMTLRRRRIPGPIFNSKALQILFDTIFGMYCYCPPGGERRGVSIELVVLEKQTTKDGLYGVGLPIGQVNE